MLQSLFCYILRSMAVIVTCDSLFYYKVKRRLLRSASVCFYLQVQRRLLCIPSATITRLKTEYLSVTSQLTVESWIDRAENA